MSSLPSAFARFAASTSPSAAELIEPFIKMGPELEQDVDKRTGLERLLAKPLVEDVEDREQSLLWCRPPPAGLGLDEFPRPSLLALVEKRQHELVLRPEMT